MRPQAKLDPASVSKTESEHSVIVVHRDHRYRPVRQFLSDVVGIDQARGLLVVGAGDEVEFVHKNSPCLKRRGGSDKRDSKCSMFAIMSL